MATYHNNQLNTNDMFQIFSDKEEKCFKVYAFYKNKVEPGTYTFRFAVDRDDMWDSIPEEAKSSVKFTVRNTKVTPKITLKAKGNYNAVTGGFHAYYVSTKNLSDVFYPSNFFKLNQYTRLVFEKTYDGATGTKLAEPEEYMCMYSQDPDDSSAILLPDGGIKPTKLIYWKQIDEDDWEECEYTIHPKDQFNVCANTYVPAMQLSDPDIECYSNKVKLGISTAGQKFSPKGTYTISGTDCFDVVRVTGIGSGSERMKITKVSLDAASEKIFSAAGSDVDAADGCITIAWKGKLLPKDADKLTGKIKTVTVNVWYNNLEEAGAKPSQTFKVKLFIQ